MRRPRPLPRAASRPRSQASARLARAVSAVDRWDLATTRRIAAARNPQWAEIGLPLLTRAADRSVLWMCTAGALTVSGNARARRAAMRGLASIAVSSLLANQVGKRAVPRRRPLLAMIPTTRVAHRVPVSSSFPSGHSASAAAFAVGVGVEAPWLALPVGLLAAAVAYSRIYTGVHFASDVIAGVAIGATVAGAGALLVPAHQVEPRRAGTEPSRPQPPRPDGRGLVAIVNSGSGSVDERFVARLKEALPAAEIVEVGADDDVRQEIERAGARAEVLGVAGGDGTINCAASVAMSRGLPLLVFPAGTYNHFARDLDLTDLDDSVEAITTGRAIRIDVGEVDGEVFLNTASLGSYPEFVRTREALEGRFGKSVAAAISLVRVMRSGPALEATVDGRRRRLLLVFVGNGDYRPRGFLPRWRAALDTGDLDVRLADVSRPRSAWKLTAAALTANLYRTRSYVERRTPDLVVRFDGPGGLLARDGEVADAPAEVRFSVRRGALTVYRGRPSGSPGRS